jgi:hypothetical protein
MYRPVYSAESSALYFSSDPISSERVMRGGRRVFVCGALQDPLAMSALLGLEPPFAPAVTTGYRRAVERLDGEDVSFMIPDEHDPRSLLTGIVWLDLSEASLEKIESLELEGGIRRRIAIEARIGELKLTAYTYIKR